MSLRCDLSCSAECKGPCKYHPEQGAVYDLAPGESIEFNRVFDIDEALLQVREELLKAQENWPPFNSAHEGFAVLLEEVDELKQHVWTNQKRRNLADMRKEALQVAAMALRYALEVCDEERGRK